MQVAIDNAKRKFDIDLSKEISRIKKDLKDRGCKYPSFWKQIKKRNDKRHKSKKQRINSKVLTEDEKKKELEHERKFNSKFDSNLLCPMNYISTINIDKKESKKTINNTEFINYHKPPEQDKWRNKRVEEIIKNYSLDLFNYNSNKNVYDENWLILNDKFNQMINDIRKISAKSNLPGLMSWLINRALNINIGGASTQSKKNSLYKNRSLLLKTLYTLDKDAFFQCFKGEND